MPQEARLTVYGQGDVEVEFAAAYLLDLNNAYNSILVFETIIDRMSRTASRFPFPYFPFSSELGWPIAPRSRAVRHIRDWSPTAEEIASLVPRAEQLIIYAVSLASPGFWEFLGTLNPLEVLRHYLNDRHERRKDHDYRETAERRRLALENLRLENEVISERIRLAKEIGATDRDLAPLLNDLVYKPLVTLDRHQDKGIVEHAELMLSDRARR